VADECVADIRREEVCIIAIICPVQVVHFLNGFFDFDFSVSHI